MVARWDKYLSQAFIYSGFFDVAGHSEKARAAVFGRAERREVFGAAVYYFRNAGERFHVVYDGRSGE